MTEAMPFLQKTILLSYDPRAFVGGDFFYFVCAARKPSIAAICMAVCSGAGPP